MNLDSFSPLGVAIGLTDFGMFFHVRFFSGFLAAAVVIFSPRFPGEVPHRGPSLEPLAEWKQRDGTKIPSFAFCWTWPWTGGSSVQTPKTGSKSGRWTWAWSFALVCEFSVNSTWCFWLGPPAMTIASELTPASHFGACASTREDEVGSTGRQGPQSLGATWGNWLALYFIYCLLYTRVYCLSYLFWLKVLTLASDPLC